MDTLDAVDSILDRVKQLPAAPQILPRLLKLLDQPDADAGKVVELLRFEPSLTAQVLRECNSASSGASQRIESLEDGLLRLGSYRIYQLTIGLYCGGMIAPAQPGYGINHGELWEHSAVSAIAAAAVAKLKDQDPHLAFTAGLLHDIGKVALSEVLVDRYTALVAEIEAGQHAFVEAEKSVLGLDHTEVGARLLARWQFSDQLVAAVRCHHQPDAAGPYAPLAAQVYMGNLLAYFLGHGYGHLAFAFRGRAEALELLDLGQDDLPGLIIAVSEELKAQQAFLQITFKRKE